MSEVDPSGRKKIVRNVVTSWLSQLVFIAFGFILPRAIDNSLGQVSLGIWDFGWTIVSYLSMAMVGIGASVNRHVAKYRASGEVRQLSASVSSVTAVQVAIGSGVFVIVVVLYYLTPSLMREQLGNQADTAASLVLLLGSSLSIQMIFDSFRGILTGCHLWITHNVLNAGGYAVTGVGMLLVISNGGGLEGMAQVYLIITLLTELLRFKIARAACPEIHLSWRNVSYADIRKMVRFGMKNVLMYLPRAIIIQTISLFVIINLGPAMLAILSRPLALVAHIATLMNKFAFVLTPIAGSLQGSGDHAELKELALKTMRAGWLFALLPTTFLMIFGDRVVELWMGSDYVNLEVLVILSVGTVFPVSQRALVTILVGMDEHGQIAKYTMPAAAAVVTIGLGLVSMFGWSLTAAALLIVVPTNIGIAAVALVVGCRVLRIGAMEYFKSVLQGPMILCVALLSGLVLVRTFGPQATLTSLAAGAAVHALIAAIVLREDIRSMLQMRRA